MRSIKLLLTLFFCIQITGSLWSQSPTLTWGRSMGANGDDFPNSIAVDDSGNVYTTGYFNGTADFDPGPGTFYLTSVPGEDVFISKLNSAGNFVWAKKVGGTYTDRGSSIVVDNLGGVFITGHFMDTVDFNPGIGVSNLISNNLSYDIFVLKLNTAGNFIWVKQINGMHNEYANAITLDPTGNILITGYFSGTVDFDPGAGTSNLVTLPVYSDVFVSKLDAGGNFIWARSFSGTGNQAGNSISTDNLGNVFTTGNFGGTVDFDPGAGTYNLTAADAYNIFISKLDAGGNLVWAKSMGASSDDRGVDLCLDDSGNVFTTGFFGGTVDFDPGAAVVNLTSSGGADIFVQKLSSAGNFVWAKKMGGSIWDHSYSICLDVFGNVLTTGGFMGTSDFNPGAGTYNLISSLGVFTFISKLDAMGNFVWARGTGGNGDNYGTSITTDAQGNVFTAGNFINTLLFGSYTTNSSGGKDIYVFKIFDCTLPLQPAAILGSSSICYDSLVTYSVPSVYGAQSYTWTLPGGWTGTSTTNSITTHVGSVGGTISVTANNICGVSPPRTLTVTVNTAPPLASSIVGDSTLCSGSTNVYSISPVAGATSYNWVLPGGWTGSSTTDSILTTAGTLGGTVSVQPNNACGSAPAQILTIVVDTVIPVITDTINGGAAVCPGSSNTYLISPVNGATSYIWNLPPGWIGSSATNSILVTPDTSSGSISVTANNACGSSAPQSLFVNINIPPTVNLVLLGNDTICFGDSIVMYGTGANTFTWSGGVVDSVQFVPLNSNLFTVTGTNGSGCFDIDSIYIVVFEPSVTYTVFPNDSLCMGDSVILTGSGTTVIIWSDSINDGIAFLPGGSYNYELIGIDNFGCSDTTSVPIVISNFNVDLGNDTSLCYNEFLSINIGNLWSSIQWWNGSSDTIEYIPAIAGTYFVNVTEPLGCAYSDTIVITAYPVFNLDLGNDTSICFNDSLLLNAGSVWTAITWWDASIGSTNLVTSIGSYFVETIDSNFCYHNDTITITNNPVNVSGYAYSSFSVPLANTPVYLVLADTSNYIVALDSALTDASGYFNMNTQLFDFSILVKPDSTLYPDQLPTYYDSSVTIQNSNFFNLNSCDSTTINMQTVQGINPGGPCFVGGTLVYGGRVINGDPVPGVKVIFINSANQVLGYTFTDSNGYFYMNGLPAGDVWFWVDWPEINNSLAPSLTLSTSTNYINVYFEFYPDQLILMTSSLGIETNESKDDYFMIYPNPSIDYLNVDLIKPGNSTAIIFDSRGAVMLQRMIKEDTKLPIQVLSPGVYYLQLNNGEQIQVKKFIKM